MKRPRSGMGTELLPVALVHLGLAGTLILVLYTSHRSAVLQRREPVKSHNTPQVVVSNIPEPEPEVEPPPVAVLPPKPLKPVEDPTKPILARLSAEETKLRAEAADADRQSEALEAARQVALAELKRWKRRESVVRAQVDALAEKAEKIEDEANALAMERDVLARRRDNEKADLAKAKVIAGGYAVLPHKGVHGTWQRPVMIECKDGQAILQPSGIAFNMIDMSPLAVLRGSPFLGAMARELVKVQQATSPDGDPVVPYIYFIVRPDGVRPYYEARSRLEPLGIAFGYELVEQDWQIEFPNFDELQTWDGLTPLRPKESPVSPLASSEPTPRAGGGGDFVWPVDRGGLDPSDSREGGKGAGNGAQRGADKPEAENGFVWPTRPQGRAGASAGGLQEPQREVSGVGGRPLGSGVLDHPGPNGGGVDFGDLKPPLPGREIGRTSPRTSRLGSPNGFDRTSTPTTGRNATGIVTLDPNQLPAFDSADGSPVAGRGTTQGQRGRGGKPRSASPGGGNSAGQPPVDLSYPGPGRSASSGVGLDFPDTTQTPTRPPSGRVRIDPALLAYVDEAQEVLDRMHGRGNGTGISGDPQNNDPTSTGSPEEGSAGQPESGTGAPPSGGGNSGKADFKPALTGGKPGSQTSSGSTAASGSSAASPGATASGGGSSDLRPSSATPPQSRPNFPPLRNTIVEVPLPLVVACASDGVTIHPGGYRLSSSALKKQGALVTDLLAIVRNHALTDPNVHPKPRIDFLIEPGGSESYTEARKQTVLSGIPWPVSFQVSETSAPRVFPKERF